MGVDRWLRAVLLAPLLRLRVRPLIHQDSAQDLAVLRDHMAEGTLTPFVDRAFPLAQIREAIRHVCAGKARGNVVVTMPSSTPAGS